MSFGCLVIVFVHKLIGVHKTHVCILIFNKEENVTYCSSNCKMLSKSGITSAELRQFCAQLHPPV
jgi:hypothetical protein